MDQRLIIQTVSKSDVVNTISTVKQKQREIVAINGNATQSILKSTYKEVYKMIGTVDTLKALELLEDDLYQSLVEQNVLLEDKIRRLIKSKKPQSSANRVRAQI